MRALEVDVGRLDCVAARAAAGPGRGAAARAGRGRARLLGHLARRCSAARRRPRARRRRKISSPRRCARRSSSTVDALFDEPLEQLDALLARLVVRVRRGAPRRRSRSARSLRGIDARPWPSTSPSGRCADASTMTSDRSATTRRRLPPPSAATAILEAAHGGLRPARLPRLVARRDRPGAGISKALIYEHFDSKRELHDALLARARRRALPPLRGQRRDRHDGGGASARRRRRVLRLRRGAPRGLARAVPRRGRPRAGAGGRRASRPRPTQGDRRAAIPTGAAGRLGPARSRCTPSCSSGACQALANWWDDHQDVPREELVDRVIAFCWDGMSQIDCGPPPRLTVADELHVRSHAAASPATSPRPCGPQNSTRLGGLRRARRVVDGRAVDEVADQRLDDARVELRAGAARELGDRVGVRASPAR